MGLLYRFKIVDGPFFLTSSPCVFFLELRSQDYHQRSIERGQTTGRGHDSDNLLPDGLRPVCPSGKHDLNEFRMYVGCADTVQYISLYENPTKT